MKHKMNDEDEFDLLESSEQLDYSLSSITHNKFEFNLDEKIKKPSYYRNLIEVLNNATEQDLVVLNINSGGGHLDSAISIIDALRNTRANTLAWISGSAFLIPTLVIFFLQVLITVSVFLVILFVLSLFYKGKTDDEIRLEETNRQVEEAKKALDTFSINK